MNMKDAQKWNTRMAALYAFGVWTMIGSYALLRYTGRLELTPVKKEEVQECEDPNRVVFRSAHTETIIVYKKDFVPYTTRIYNFFQYFGTKPGDK
ncbi:hypothetical protein ABVT39_027209 [Epinephelus coioides]